MSLSEVRSVAALLKLLLLYKLSGSMTAEHMNVYLNALP